MQPVFAVVGLLAAFPSPLDPLSGFLVPDCPLVRAYGKGCWRLTSPDRQVFVLRQRLWTCGEGRALIPLGRHLLGWNSNPQLQKPGPCESSLPLRLRGFEILLI